MIENDEMERERTNDDSDLKEIRNSMEGRRKAYIENRVSLECFQHRGTMFSLKAKKTVTHGFYNNKRYYD